ncbi:cytochrome c-like [Arvicola amphibius]|uniref:cytochrome c-like n=1 Tax=Arvicola amphibius TaxID=1047088 RepID=UPI0018E302F7|nr:cytochrome c-like [Arvicola amphibius]
MVDVERGKKTFVQSWAQCHTVEKGDKHKTGPNLQVCLGRRQGTGFFYTDTNKSKGITWTGDTLRESQEEHPWNNNKTIFTKIKKEERVDLTAYL